MPLPTAWEGAYFLGAIMKINDFIIRPYDLYTP